MKKLIFDFLGVFKPKNQALPNRGGFGNALKSVWDWGKRVLNRYEAAYWNWSGDRTYIQSSVQDARFDADSSARIEILRKARYFEANNAICNRLVDLFEQFTVGATGLQVIPDSSNEAWNQLAAESWQTWCKYPDLVSLQYFGCLQSQMARRWFIDGEVFIHKTISPDTRRPRLRLYESHRCYTPKDKSKEEGVTIVDGVGIDAIGRPISYWIKQSDKDEGSAGFKEIPASEIIHLFEPERPGMYRGLSFLYPVMNDLHDLDDIQMYMKRTSKNAARLSAVIKNAAGEPNAATLRRARMNTNSQNAAGTSVTKADDQYYKSTLGDDTIYLRTGEDISQFGATRPSASEQAFWEHLIAKICAGVGISKLLVLPYSMQGTVTRADLDISTIFFRSRSAVIETAVRSIYEWYMFYASRFDKTMAVQGGTPKDWFKACVRPPRAPNVDTGRNSNAIISEYQAGLRTLQDICAELGLDWHEQMTQRAEEIAFAIRLLENPKYKGITLAQIINPTGALPVPPQTEPDADYSSGKAPEMRFQLT